MLSDVRTIFASGAIGGLPDGQLLARFASRAGEDSEAAFTALVLRHGPMVLRACRALLRDEHAAQDAFQATFLVLARKASHLWIRDSLGPWLHGVACRLARDVRKAETRRRVREHKVAALVVEASVADHRETDDADLVAILHEEIGRLTAAYRVVVVLCDLEGHTLESAAHELRCPVGTVKSRRARARDQLRARLSVRGLAPSAGLIVAALEAETKAAMPETLVASTTRAALHVVSNQSMAGVVSAAVAKLLQGVRWVLVPAGLRTVAPVLLTTAVAVGGLVYGARFADDGPAPEIAKDDRPAVAVAPAAPARPGLDHHGDPLPPGARLRLGTVQARQGEDIVDLAFTPDGKALLSGSGDGTIVIRDAANGRPLRKIHGNVHDFRAVVLSRDGKTIATAGITFARAGRQTFDEWTVFDFATGRSMAHCEWGDEQSHILSLAMSPDGKNLATGSGNGVVRLWDIDTGKERLKLKLGQVDVQAVAFSPDGATLAACSRDGNGHNNRIHLIDPARGVEVRFLSGPDRPIRALAYSPDGKMLASAADEPTVILWDVASGRELHRLDGGNSYQGGLAFSPDGSSLATLGGGVGNSVLTVWEIATGRRLQRVESSSGWYCRVAFSPDGKTIAFDSRMAIHLWDLATGRDRLSLPDAHEQAVTRLLCADGGKTLITGGDDNTARVWDLTTGRQRSVMRHKGWVRALALSPDERLLATGVEYPGRSVHLWDVATGRLRWWTSPNRSTSPAALKFAKDGATLLTLWRDGSARRFEVVTGRELDAETPKLSIEKSPMSGEELVETAEYSSDGTKIAATNSMGAGVYVADAGTSKPLFHERAWTFTFSPDGKTLLISKHLASRTELVDGKPHIKPREGIFRLLDASTGRPRLEIRRPDSSFCSGALSPDGTLLAVAMKEDSPLYVIRLFDAADGRERFVLRGHNSFVSKLAFTPDGRSLISGSSDTTVLVWDVPNSP